MNVVLFVPLPFQNLFLANWLLIKLINDLGRWICIASVISNRNQVGGVEGNQMDRITFQIRKHDELTRGEEIGQGIRWDGRGQVHSRVFCVLPEIQGNDTSTSSPFLLSTESFQLRKFFAARTYSFPSSRLHRSLLPKIHSPTFIIVLELLQELALTSSRGHSSLILFHAVPASPSQPLEKCTVLFGAQ